MKALQWISAKRHRLSSNEFITSKEASRRIIYVTGQAVIQTSLLVNLPDLPIPSFVNMCPIYTTDVALQVSVGTAANKNSTFFTNTGIFIYLSHLRVSVSWFCYLHTVPSEMINKIWFPSCVNSTQALDLHR